MSRVADAIRPALVPILAIITAFIVGSIFILITDFENLSKLGHGPGRRHRRRARARSSTPTARWRSARSATRHGSPPRSQTRRRAPSPPPIRPITETLVAATPLIFTGLAVAVSFRSGVFNIGVEGQFILGAFGAATAAIALKDQPMFLIILVVDADAAC